MRNRPRLAAGRGSYTMTLPADDKGEGRYLVRAAYTDKGSKGAPPIRAEQTLLLRNPKIPAGKADKTDGTMKHGTIIIATVKGPVSDSTTLT